MGLFINTTLNYISIRPRLINKSENNLISNDEQLFYATDLLLITFSIILLANPRGKNSINSQINPGSTDDSQNSKVCTINILLDSGTSESIVHKDVLHKGNQTLKDKKNKRLTMAGIFNTYLLVELKLKLPESNHSAKIYAKCNLTDDELNYNLILGSDILHELAMIFFQLRK